MNCVFCNKLCNNDNSLRNHERMCKFNPNRQKSPFENTEIQKNRKKSNQHIKSAENGLTYTVSGDTIEKIKKTLQSVWTEEKRKQWSVKMKQQARKNLNNHPESYSYKNFCGRSKKTYYKDCWMHSSWELEFAKWCDNHSIRWTKKVKSFEYMWNGETKKYFPDFYLFDYDVYVEIKGYQTDRDIEKWKSVSNLLILKKTEIDLIKENKYIIGQIS